MMTTTGFEKFIVSYAAEHGRQISRSKAQRMAHQLCKRQARMNDETLERIFTHNDPTARQAIHNIENRRVPA
ncbi:hypothetical protein [Arthrobacter flavus]|uniref:Uncharacterized protein n=1 Tax=Arthrobacter flavus TaxID=95172 RepID=A0ABW4Q3W5_9MICC